MPKQRRSPRPPNYFRSLDEHPRGEDHPIDLAVRRRVPQKAARKRLRSLQRTVEAQLGNKKAFLELEELWSTMRIERDEGYFNVGYECGLAEGVARANPLACSEKGRRLAREVRALVVQAQLPPGEVVPALLECLGAALSAAATPVSLKLPPGPAT